MTSSSLQSTPPGGKRRGRKPRPVRQRQLAVEHLEQREVPATGLFLQGTAFNDANSNGQLDTGESYLAGATVSLYNQGGTLLASVTTGTDGRYLFDASNTGGALVAGGTYDLVQQAPGYTSTGAQALSQINPASVVAPDRIRVTLADPSKLQVNYNTDDLFNNPALYQVETYTINGVTQTSSVGQMPVTISGTGSNSPVSILTLCNNIFQDFHLGANSFQVEPQTTNSDTSTPISTYNEGRIAYLYNHYGTTALGSADKAAALQLAAWELEYDKSPNLASGKFLYNGPLASLVQAYLNESAGKSEAAIFLDANKIITGGWQGIIATGSYNFGNAPQAPAQLAGCVYVDADKDGVHDKGEVGIAGVTVTLKGTDEAGNKVILTTTTDADGNFAFTNLRAGTYRLIETQPVGYLDGKDSAGNYGGTVANDVIHSIILPPGANAKDYCFGEYTTSEACISGFVYVDANNNGIKEAGEAPIGGVTVTLTGTTSTGQSVSLTTVTDFNGFYHFDNLPAGTYTITETQPAGFTDGKDTAGSAGGKVTNDKISNIKLKSGVCATDYNFGEKSGSLVTTGQTATIGFWNNKNGQALINSFNGGPTATALSTWLATSFPKLYGAQAGANNLTGFTNTQVADYFKLLFQVQGQKVYAQLLGNALAIYATTSSLGGTAAVQYGFTVTAAGLGASLFNVGTSGAAFGVPDYTMMSVLDIVKAANNSAVGGLLYGGDQTLINLANSVFDGINQQGDII